MSVKSKVKRCNKEIERLKEELETEQLSNRRLRSKLDDNDKLLENIVKFAITNQVGGLRGGMMIDRYSIDKMKNLRLIVEYSYEVNAYKIMTTY